MIARRALAWNIATDALGAIVRVRPVADCRWMRSSRQHHTAAGRMRPPKRLPSVARRVLIGAGDIGRCGARVMIPRRDR
jgi:hypothetical protein